MVHCSQIVFSGTILRRVHCESKTMQMSLRYCLFGNTAHFNFSILLRRLWHLSEPPPLALRSLVCALIFEGSSKSVIVLRKTQALLPQMEEQDVVDIYCCS